MESFLGDLKEQVKCSLCNELMVEPKVLPCFHTFCETCIKRHTQLVDQDRNIFKCPHCTSEALLQDLDDVDDLQTSPIHSRILQVLSFVENHHVCSVSASHHEALWLCLDCNRSLCDECQKYHSEFIKNHKVVSLSELKKDDVEIMLNKESACTTHTKEDVELYCKDCSELICLLCFKELHQSHKTTSLQEFIVTLKDSMSENLNQIEKLSTNEEEKKRQEQIAVDIKRDGEKAKEQVKKLTKKLMNELIDKEQQLLNEIQTSITKADRNLRIIRHRSAAQEYIKYFIQNGTASEMIDIRDKQSSTKFSYDPFVKRIGMEFSPNEELCKQVNTGLGHVRSFVKAEPQMSSFKVEEILEAGQNAKLTVLPKNCQGENCIMSPDDVTIHITPDDGVIVGEQQVTTDGQIEVAFTPRVPGQLIAEVKLHDNPVSNSPLMMDVKPQQIKELDTHSKLINALNTGSKDFTGIAVNNTNTKIAVEDFPSHCVRVFTLDGDLLLTYGSKGSGHGQLYRPWGLSFVNENDVVIADSDNHRICIVNTTTGKLVKTFGCKGNGNGQFSDHYDVHVDNDSNIIVCDDDRVQVFTKDGDYRYQFSLPNGGKPRGVVTYNGLYYVSDSKNSVVHVIDMKDNQSPTTVTTIGRTDYTDGQLQEPWGLAIDNDNNLLVCDHGSKSIHKFALDGRYTGKSNRSNSTPWYIAVLNNGQIICTMGREGVHAFR